MKIFIVFTVIRSLIAIIIIIIISSSSSITIIINIVVVILCVSVVVFCVSEPFETHGQNHQQSCKITITLRRLGYYLLKIELITNSK